MKNKELTQSHKIIFIFCFISISVAILYMRNIVVSGYETSIYWSIPFPILLLILLPIMYGAVSIFIFKSKENYFLILNLILFLMIGLVVLFIPNIKGYTFYPMGDPPSHAGVVIDIISQGRIPEELIYPITHILISELYYVSGIDYTTIVIILAPIYSIISAIYLYVLAYHIFKDNYKAILTTCIGFFSLASAIPNPHIFAALLTPLVLFIFLRSMERNWDTGDKILLIIFAVLYPFFHPLVDIILIMSILLIGILYRFVRDKNLIQISPFYSISMVSLIILFLWLWYKLWYWNYYIGRMIRWFIYDTADKGRYYDVMSIFNEYSINPLNLILKIYGQNVIYIIFSFLTVFLIVKKMRYSTDDKTINEKIVLLSGWIFLNLFIAFVVIFSPSIGGPDRMIYYAGIVTPIFVTYLFLNLKRITRHIMILILSILIINSVFTIHQSSYTYLPNLQVTYMEVMGSSWLIDHNDQDLKVRSNHERFYRIADLVKGVNYTNNHNLNEIRNPDYGTEPLDHFGYNTYERIGDAYKEYSYLILEKYDDILYFDLYPSSIKFNKTDFDKLYFDNTVNKIYDNGEFMSQLVRGSDKNII